MGKDKGSSGHEFTAEQNKVIKDLSQAMMIVAIAWFVYGGISLIVPFVGWVTGAILIAIGVYLWGAMKSMKSIVETEGNDIEHLMQAIDKLRSYFKTFAILTIIGIVVLVLFSFLLVGLLASR